MTTTYSHSAAFNDLAPLTGALFPSTADYEQVRQLWNGRVKHNPAIARCLTVQDVIHTFAGHDRMATPPRRDIFSDDHPGNGGRLICLR